jgi:hypothetical protein
MEPPAIGQHDADVGRTEFLTGAPPGAAALEIGSTMAGRACAPLTPPDLRVGPLSGNIRGAVVVDDATSGQIVLWYPATRASESRGPATHIRGFHLNANVGEIGGAGMAVRVCAIIRTVRCGRIA